jgi:uncharacterized protein
MPAVEEADHFPQTVEFVVKASKFCNLRCQYCYEFEQLGSREQMSSSDLERLYRHIAAWHQKLDRPTILDFVWHGGEPLLNSPSYFESTFEQQRAIFGRDVSIRNTIQTNLTVLDQPRIDLLRQFDKVGVSIDLYGELRTNLSGRDSVRSVLQNMDRLHANGIDFGCITVLTARNIPNIRKIVRFFHRLGVRSVRLLPLIDGANADQHQAFDTTPSDVVNALQEAFEEIVALNSDLLIEPLAGYIRQVTHHHTHGAAPILYDKARWEPVFLVDTNGDVYSYGNAYDTEFRHGNLFRTAMQDIVSSPGHQLAIETAAARMAAVCHSCRFYGSCSGYPIAEEAPLQQRNGEPLACNIDRPMLEYVERRLLELGSIGRVPVFAGPSNGLRHVRPAQLPLQRDVCVRIDVPGDPCPEDRIALSAGTTNKAPPPNDGLHYIAAAVVPRSPFRSLTRLETDLLLVDAAQSSWRIGRDVAVVRIPDDVISPLMQIFEDFGTSESLENYQDHTSHPAWSESYGRLSDHVKQNHALDGGEPRVVRLGNSLPGSVTVTKDTVSGQSAIHYVGMHVDSWLDVPLDEREYSQNRICINVGRDARQFLFINLGLARMHAILHGTPLADSAYYGSDLGHDFMRAYPDYPVVRLTIQPGEAYIAPTENVIHDGSSIGMTCPDLALHMIGRLAPSAIVHKAVLDRMEL